MQTTYHQRGFTLIELIMVIVIMGVLAVFAAPRMLNTGDFYARGFHDETLGLLRYAQKTAIAQRRTVCVAFSKPAPASAVLTIASAPSVSACNTALTGPNKNCPDGTPVGAKGCIKARSGISYSSGPAGLSFNGLGQPLDAAGVPVATAVEIQVSDAASVIKVEAQTGYVHD
ncbi:MAG: hypothetical protein COZ09_00705 [Comamonadaceae bacterium CG_4_10_14_3_um_filter_60_42]|nr:MAG: hypothetical protein COZ09_00705 [Comamonadaceae bacterium CG_4_10_14_3_um_filter_60_42]